MTIYLARLLPDGSSGLPGNHARWHRSELLPHRCCSLLDLAPDRGCLTAILLCLTVVFYTTFSPLPVSRRYVSVALSDRLPRPGVSPVSCSAECGLSSIIIGDDRGHPTNPRHFHHTIILKKVNE